MKRFDNKVVLVSGGRSGIGLAISRRLRDEGARVFTAQRGNDSEFEYIPADFTNPEDASRVIEQLVAQCGGLDVLINNAGMMQDPPLNKCP